MMVSNTAQHFELLNMLACGKMIMRHLNKAITRDCSASDSVFKFT